MWLVVLLLADLVAPQEIPSVISVDPISGSRSGGTVISVMGAQFMEGATCVFENPSLGSAVSQVTTLHNSSYLQCTMPALDYLNFRITDGHTVGLSVTSGPGSQSNSIEFLVYDVEAMSISSISPSEGLHYVANTVIIHGQGFVDTGEGACHISHNGTDYICPVVFINGTELQCTLPPLLSPTLQPISVSLNQQEVTFIPTVNNATLFIFTADPPSIISATFNSAYTALYLAFNHEVALGGITAPVTPIPLSCVAVLSLETLLVLGTGAECDWRNSQQREILISLPRSSTVRPNIGLTLLDGTIRTRYASYSRLASGTVNVTLSFFPLTPIAVIEGPYTIPPCGDLILRGQCSQGGGYAPLLYHWDLTVVHGEEFSQEVQVLSFPTGFSSLADIAIESELLSSDTQYLIRLTVRNFLGIESSTTHILTPSMSHFLPLSIKVGSIQKLCAHKPLILEASPVDLLPECSNYTTASKYQWRVRNDNGGTEEILNAQTNVSVLTLPPFSLLHNQTYIVTANTELEAVGASTLIATSEPCLVAHIKGGDYRELNQSTAVVLDGSRSEGLSAAVEADHLFHVEWACSLDGLPCLTKEGLELKLPDEVTVSIPPYTLPLGTYTIKLSLQYSDYMSVAETTVEIVNDSHTLLQVTLPGCCGPVLVHTNVTILAMVYSMVPSRVRWSVQSVPGYAELELSPLVTSSPLSLPILTAAEVTRIDCSDNLLANVTNQIALNIVGGVLLHDNTYRISLEAFDDMAQSLTKVFIDVHTALPPSHGGVRVHYAHSNITQSSVITIIADGWTDNPNHTPLMYRFGLWWHGMETTNPCNTSNPSCYRAFSWISGYSLEPQLKMAFFPSHYTVVVEVINTLGAVTVASLEILGSDPITAVPALEGVGMNIMKGGRWREEVAALSVLLRATDSLFSDIGSARAIILETLIYIHQYHLPSSPSHLTLLLSLLHQATSTSLLPSSTALQAARVVEDVVAVLASSTDKHENVALGFSEKISTATTALETLFGLVLKYSNNAEHTRVQASLLTSSLLSSLPLVGYRVCQQLSTGESEFIVIGDNGGSLKISQSLLLAHYSAGVLCNHKRCSGRDKDVIIDFGSNLYRNYFQWVCNGAGPAVRHNPPFCFGICVVSALLNFDLHWLGKEYTHYIVSRILSLSLLHPLTGQGVSFSLDKLGLHFIGISSFPHGGDLLCAVWDAEAMTWSTNKCNTLVVGSDGVMCECDFTGNIEAALIERCSPGRYGSNCTEECPHGLWGEECAELCDCSERGTCYSHDGSCDCDPGWMGQSCQKECQAGRWGKGCAEVCLCINAVSCDHISGACDCMNGWTGQLCDSECSNGTYGYYCTKECQCRLDSECQKEDGTCVCEAGYTGDLCLDPCSEGSFGSHCEAACECSTLGTVSCHHVTGDCSCHANYTGSICDELIVVEAGLPAVALALPMVVILITAASITSLGIAFWRRKKKKRVAPVSNGGEGGTEGESVRGESDGESSQDNLLNMTAAKSLEVLVPKGKELKELFPQKEADEDLFQEPSQAHTKLRWQVVQVVSQEMGCVALETTHKGESDNESELFPSKVSFSFQAENQENMNEPEDKKSMEDEAQDATGGSGGLVSEGQGEDRAVMIVYRRGVYLNPDATLKDLRNSFLDSGQLEGKNRFFEFLMSDVPGDTIAIETEPETYLSKLESDFAEPRTIHFQLMDEDGHSELCVCGRYADLECSECHAQGYCSSACQTQHWAQHATSCRVVSARRRRRRRRRKHRKKSHEICTILTSGCDLCPCGREVEFDCSQCDVQGYCSEQCQVKDWPRHQTLCYKRGESP